MSADSPMLAAKSAVTDHPGMQRWWSPSNSSAGPRAEDKRLPAPVIAANWERLASISFSFSILSILEHQVLDETFSGRHFLLGMFRNELSCQVGSAGKPYLPPCSRDMVQTGGC